MPDARERYKLKIELGREHLDRQDCARTGALVGKFQLQCEISMYEGLGEISITPFPGDTWSVTREK